LDSRAVLSATVALEASSGKFTLADLGAAATAIAAVSRRWRRRRGLQGAGTGIDEEVDEEVGR
jgi:hypothetical protein